MSYRQPRQDYSHTPSSPYQYQPARGSTQGLSSLPAQQRKAELKDKIKEIIGLCKDENITVTRDIAGVAEAERGILGLLDQASLAAGEAAGQAEPHYPSNPANAPSFTPVRGQQQQADPGKAMQQDIRQILASKGQVELSEEAVQLINEIERRCLSEIEKMRNERLQLTAQLNEEIKQHNATAQRKAELERHLEAVARGQPGQQLPGDQQLRDRVVYLEELLAQVQQEGGRAEQHPDFRALFAQGEAIRQETLRLLKSREGRGQGEDSEKRRLREENEALVRRVELLEQERQGLPSKPSYEVIQEEYSPIGKSQRPKDSFRNSANEYESLVMEMRKITNS